MAENGLTASELIQQIYSNHLNQIFRSYNFVGRRGEYVFPHPDYYIIVAFQKSKYFNSLKAEIIMNLTVISHREWENIKNVRPSFSDTPQPKVLYSDVVEGYTGRVGSLGQGSHSWHTINVDTFDAIKIVSQISYELKKYALPIIEDRTGLSFSI